MNFLNSLEKAQKLGVSNDEFITMWKAELKDGYNRPSEDQSQVSSNEPDQGGTDDNLPQPLRQGKNQVTQELTSKLQFLFDKNAEKQEHIWQEMRNKNDKMAIEFRQQFEIVCQHVKNTVEYQTDSLKLFFMQELEIMKQNLVKIIDDRCHEYQTSVISSPRSLETTKVDLNQDTRKSHKNNLDSNEVEGDMVDSKLLPPSKKDDTGTYCFSLSLQNGEIDLNQKDADTRKNNLSVCDINEETSDNELLSEAGYAAACPVKKETWVDKQCEEILPEADYDLHMESTDRSPSLKNRKANSSDDDNYATNHNLSSHLKEKRGSGSCYIVRSKSRGSPTLTNQTDTSSVKSSHSLRSLATSLADAPVEATGFYAKAISNQIKQNFSQSCSNINDTAHDEDWGSSSEQRTGDYVSKHKKDLARPKVFNYLHWQGFNIHGFSKYGDSDISYMSPFLYPEIQSWKARLCISFGSKGQLKVCVCVTEGDGSNHHEWPIRITANGFIFHEFSKRFTQIWELTWVTCHKPSVKEVKFPAKICLATKRGSYPDVTYDELVWKHYLENNKAVFKWSLKAERLG